MRDVVLVAEGSYSLEGGLDGLSCPLQHKCPVVLLLQEDTLARVALICLSCSDRDGAARSFSPRQGWPISEAS